MHDSRTTFLTGTWLPLQTPIKNPVATHNISQYAKLMSFPTADLPGSWETNSTVAKGQCHHALIIFLHGNCSNQVESTGTIACLSVWAIISRRRKLKARAEILVRQGLFTTVLAPSSIFQGAQVLLLALNPWWCVFPVYESLTVEISLYLATQRTENRHWQSPQGTKYSPGGEVPVATPEFQPDLSTSPTHWGQLVPEHGVRPLLTC